MDTFSTMNYKEKITSDPSIMLGKPAIKGTRLTVEHILRKLSEGASFEQIISFYPNITRDDILATLEYSAEVVGKEELIAV